MIRIVEKVQNKILRPVYKKVFFNILRHSFRISHQSLKKVLIRPPKNILEKNQICIKNAEFYAHFRSAKRITQKSMQKEL